MAEAYAVDIDKPKKKKKKKVTGANFINRLADSMNNNAGKAANPPSGPGLGSL